MSYILEALKKSEKKRQGEPNSLARLATHETEEQKSAPPRRPLWPLILGLALVVNAAVMLLIFWPADTPPLAPAEDMPAQTTRSALEHAKTQAQQRSTSEVATPSPAPGVIVSDPDVTMAPEPAEPVVVDSPAPPRTETQIPKAQKQTSIPAAGTAASRTSEHNPSVTDSSPLEQSAKTNSLQNTEEAVVSATRALPKRTADKPRAQPNPSATENPPPRYSDLSATLRARLPELHMSVHAYSADPSGGLVRVNNKMLRPGAYLQEGIRLEAITRKGAIFSYAGQEFLLPRR